MYTNPNKLFDFLFGKIFKVETSPEIFGKIPDEVMGIVFNYLSPEDFSKLPLVCRRWKAITRNSYSFMSYHIFLHIYKRVEIRNVENKDGLLLKNFNISIGDKIKVKLVESVVSREEFPYESAACTCYHGLGRYVINDSDKTGVDFSINEVCQEMQIELAPFLFDYPIRSICYLIEILNEKLLPGQLDQILKLQRFFDDYFHEINSQSETSGPLNYYRPLFRVI
ncbi:MAG: hypothetical protein K940chlam3_01130 [Chlamydiae bacterium]|nr:hypothetical protein [Chlamydiota bacterium]